MTPDEARRLVVEAARRLAEVGESGPDSDQALRGLSEAFHEWLHTADAVRTYQDTGASQT
jgi:hypothetical protein